MPARTTEPSRQALLIDTHLLIWMRTASAKLEAAEREAITAARRRYVSIVSLWEIALLQNLGRLPAVEALLEVPRGFELLAIDPLHCATYAVLPQLHRDPFDRMLIAQAKSEKLTLMTRDAIIAQYGV